MIQRIKVVKGNLRPFTAFHAFYNSSPPLEEAFTHSLPQLGEGLKKTALIETYPLPNLELVKGGERKRISFHHDKQMNITHLHPTCER